MPDGTDQKIRAAFSSLVDYTDNQESDVQIHQATLLVPRNGERNGSCLSSPCPGQVEQSDSGFLPGYAKILKDSNLHCYQHSMVHLHGGVIVQFLPLLPGQVWCGSWTLGEHYGASLRLLLRCPGPTQATWNSGVQLP